ncbi:unnamed protein product [Orchesella dallaii]|uniref:Uncharacterized protein n=1 Tax=Orchesella dallaii TaxID=48710 RepID=A0ABP1QI25_9HEXA
MSTYRWCGWCCCCRPQECICCRCCLCSNCCRCPPPCLPCVCPMPQMPQMPCMGPPPPPTRIIREQVLVPYPVPVPMCPTPTCPPPCIPQCSPPCGGGDCCTPRTMPRECCYEPDPLIEIYHPCPPAFPKRCKFTKQNFPAGTVNRAGISGARSGTKDFRGWPNSRRSN